MPFPRLYENETCPLHGYEGITLRILANPTSHEWDRWTDSHLGVRDCADCAKLRTPRGKAKAGEVESGEKKFCARCTAARERYGQSLHLFYSENTPGDLDFSSPEAALATIERPDIPDEILTWLVELPNLLLLARREKMRKNFRSSSAAAN